jgi:L-ascorbate metabolism protein UlaG (beta-lactamase superfamily)
MEDKMNRAEIFSIFIGIFLLIMTSASGANKESIEKIFKALKWYGHASFAIESEKIIYIDPWKIPSNAPQADIILVTHSHFDHLSPSDINNLRREGTIIICSADCASQLSGEVKVLKPGEELELKGIKIKAVAAYNPAKPFHPRKNNWLGYLITIDGVRIYHAGDTDFIPEMKDLGEVNIALFPVGGKYTMNAEEAAKAASIIKADISIPMHYGAGVIGSEKDALKFKQLYQGEVRILNKEK